MRILHVISSVNPLGGGPIAGLKKLALQYEQLGVTLEIACCDDPRSEWLLSTDLPKTHALGPSSWNYSYTRNLLPWLKENAKRFDAVVIDGIWQYHSLAVWIALSKTTIPYFVFTHGMLGPWFKKKHPLKHLKKWLYWPWADYRVLRDARAVLFTCDEERLLARDSFWLYKANEEVIGFGTSYPPEKSAELLNAFYDSYPHLKGKRIILFLGRIHEIKGCDLLLESFSCVSRKDKNLHLVMAGPNQSSWGKDLEYYTKENHNITWTGMLEEREKWAAIYAADVFCLPSHHENFGVVVAEALACGKPVLISNQVNIWREISSWKAGFVDDDSIEGTTANLNKWLALSQPELFIMQEQAKMCFKENFHIKKTAERLIKAIRRMI